jgi:hypothetical protein
MGPNRIYLHSKIGNKVINQSGMAVKVYETMILWYVSTEPFILWAFTCTELIAQYWVRTVIIDGIGVVFKFCTVIEETLSGFEMYCVNRFVPNFIVLSSVNIVQYLFICGSVVMVGTSRIMQFVIVRGAVSIPSRW